MTNMAALCLLVYHMKTKGKKPSTNKGLNSSCSISNGMYAYAVARL